MDWTARGQAMATAAPAYLLERRWRRAALLLFREVGLQESSCLRCAACRPARISRLARLKRTPAEARGYSTRGHHANVGGGFSPRLLEDGFECSLSMR